MININTSPDKLKKSILQEAMQGQLTQQLPEDGDAEDLLQSIAEEKQRLYKAGKIKEQKQLSAITDDEIPFKIPDNWQWVKLNNISLWQSGGYTPKKSDPKNYNGNLLWLRSGDLNNNYIYDTKDKISTHALRNNSLRLVPKNSIIMARVGGITIAKLGIVTQKATYNDQCFSCIPYINNVKFIFYYLMSQKHNLENLSSGGVQSSLPISKVRNYLIPIPPLAEQKRIVTKLDALLPEVDSFKQSVHYIQVLRSELPPRLRRSFLQEAMQGKLTQQLPEDGDAEDLLQSIAEEKQRLYKDGKIKKPKQLSAITDDEIPFKIPDNWQWVRIPEISLFPHQRSINPKDVTNSTWVLDLKEIEKNTGKIISKEYNLNKKVKSSKVIFRQNDVLFNKLRPYLNKVIVAPDKGVATSELFVIHLLGEINPQYIAYALRSPFFLNKINEDTYGTKMPRVGTRKFIKYLLPLPPLNEQNRIVNKLDSLLSKIDKI